MTLHNYASPFYKTLLSLSFFLLLFCGARAQQPTIDSLTNELKKHPQIDSLHLKMLSDLAYAYHTIYPDSTTVIAERVYNLSAKINHQKGIADALKVWAIGSYLIADFDNALERCHQALTIYEKLGDLKSVGAVLNNIAIFHHNEGRLDEALSYYHQSLTIREETNNSAGVADCYNNIGNVYTDKGNYSESLYYLFRALAIREKANDELAMANSYSNIANIYYVLGKSKASLNYAVKSRDLQHKIGNKDGEVTALVTIGSALHLQKKDAEAMREYQKALVIANEIGSSHAISLCEINIAEMYLNLNQYADALKTFEHSLKLAEQNKDPESIIKSLEGLGLANIHLHRAQQAIPYLLKGYQLSIDIGTRFRTFEITQSLAKAYQQVNDYTNAYRYLQKSVAYKDSLFNGEVTKRTQQVEFNFILDKKQHQISLLEKDRAIEKEISDRRRLGNISLFAVLLLSITLVISLWNNSRKMRKANDITNLQKEEISRQAEELKEHNALKDKIFSVLSHDLRSPVASLTGIMTLMDQDMLTPEEFSQVKKGLNNQLDSLSLLLDNLLFWSRSQINGHIVIRKEKFNVVQIINQNIQLLNEYAHQKQVSLTMVNAANDEMMAFADVNHTGIVIRNLISNAIKFTNPDGTVDVKAEIKDQNIIIQVSDTGIGMSETLASQLFSNKLQSNVGTSGEKGAGLGLLLCKDFAEQNNGKLSVTSKPEEGSTFYFTLPKA